jgi:UDP-N-acetylmuramoyl-L-alanyl-D-glutamate--2,6-diaminopimelate ligase
VTERMGRWRRELDRAAAIALAVDGAGAHDVVVVAGKGHERTQEQGGRKVPFSDADQVCRALERKHPCAGRPERPDFGPQKGG